LLRFWVRHALPKFIEISATQIIEQFREGGYYEPETCDALLRRFQQGSIPTNWRHFLETDFVVTLFSIIQNQTMRFSHHTKKYRAPTFICLGSTQTSNVLAKKNYLLKCKLQKHTYNSFYVQIRVIAGEDYLSSRSIQHQWTGKHIQTDISKCMLVVSTFHNDLARRLFTIFLLNKFCILFSDLNTCYGREQMVIICLGLQEETTDHIRTVQQNGEMGSLRQGCGLT
jgi:hypothetical protein